jgi:sugar-specific transcriptional regulator TrmB
MNNQYFNEINEALNSLQIVDSDRRVYLYCLNNGSESISNMAKALKVQRKTLYASFERLEKAGLMPAREKFGQAVRIVSPKELVTLLEKKKNELSFQTYRLETILPDLLANFSAKNDLSTLRVFSGNKQIYTAWDNILNEDKGGLLFVGEWSNVQKILGAEVEAYWQKKRERKNMTLKVVKIDPEIKGGMLISESNVLWNVFEDRKAVLFKEKSFSGFLQQIFGQKG